MKVNKKELEKWVNNCNVSGCKHKNDPDQLYEHVTCELCKQNAHTIMCGHDNGTKYACLNCGQKWEASK